MSLKRRETRTPCKWRRGASAGALATITYSSVTRYQWVGKDGDSLDFAYLHRKLEKRAEEGGHLEVFRRAKHM